MAVLEWTDPPFCAGHWIPDLVTAAGGQSALGGPGARSHPVTWDEVATASPDLIVVAPCGYRLDGAEILAGICRPGAVGPAGDMDLAV